MLSSVDSVPIVFSTDHKFIIAAGVALYTLLANASESVYDIYFLIDKDVTDEDKNALKRQLDVYGNVKHRITFLHIENEFADAHVERHFTKATYYRLLIPWLFPQFDKIFYSDIDLIFNCDLGSLYRDCDLTDKYVCGVNRDSAYSGKLYKQIKKLGLNHQEYINAGFILINCSLQRSDNLIDKFREYSVKPFENVDQDVINCVCKGRIGHFDQSYNQRPEKIVQNSDSSYNIIHYVGLKPWNAYTACWFEWWWAYRNSEFYSYDFYNKKMAAIHSEFKMLKNFEKAYKHPVKFAAGNLRFKFLQLFKVIKTFKNKVVK